MDYNDFAGIIIAGQYFCVIARPVRKLVVAIRFPYRRAFEENGLPRQAPPSSQ